MCNCYDLKNAVGHKVRACHRLSADMGGVSLIVDRACGITQDQRVGIFAPSEFDE